MRRRPSRHVLLLAAALVACKGGHHSDPPDAPGAGGDVEAAVPVEAAALIADYKANEQVGDQRWKGKVVEVTGSVNFVHNGLIGERADVMLNAGAMFEVPQIKCYLRTQQTETAAKLSRGQKVTMRGRVTGLRTKNVQIDDCEIVSAPAQAAGSPGQSASAKTAP